MKRLLLFLLVLPLAAVAQSGINGTWRIDVNKGQMDLKPMVYELKDGTFSCESCDPRVSIKADGTDQKISGSPYTDTESATVVNPNTVELVGKKDGKVTFRSMLAVSQDGKVLTNHYEGHPPGSTQAVTGTAVSTRIGPTEADAHVVSGSWKPERWESVSDNVLTFAYTLEGDSLSYKANTGESYKAKFDGKDYPYLGDPGTSSVVLKRVDDRTFEEIYKRNGEVIGSSEMIISPDGRTLTILSEDKHQGRTNRWVAEKQMAMEAAK